jgi:predicted permease
VQVSFQLLIPCMLFSKVAATLATQPDPTLLLGIACMALFQIRIGALCGLVLTPLMGVNQQDAAQQSRASSWQGRTSPAAASAIALSIATASGAPMAATALRPRQPPPPAGGPLGCFVLRVQQQRLHCMQLHPLPSILLLLPRFHLSCCFCCPAGPGQLVPAAAAFGNSFTLPAVFLTTLLPPALADRALGYAALFLLAWSPCLWSLGMALITGKQQKPPTGAAQAAAAAAAQQQQELEQQQGSGGGGPKPLAWRQPRVVDVTPAADSSSSSSGGSSSGEQLELPSPPSWAERLAQHPFTAQVCQFAAQVLNPPVLAILAGMVTGLTPAGRALLAASKSSGVAAVAAGASTAGAVLPPELGLLHAAAKATLEVHKLRAGQPSHQACCCWPASG